LLDAKRIAREIQLMRFLQVLLNFTMEHGLTLRLSGAA
jgi:hypothetical protein